MSYLKLVPPLCESQAHASTGLPEAMRLFDEFHCFPADRTIRVRCGRLMPGVMVRLGRLKGLIYSSDRGQQGRSRTFIHFLKTPPVLACDAPGKQLYILGGRYRVTRKGIEG